MLYYCQKFMVLARYRRNAFSKSCSPSCLVVSIFSLIPFLSSILLPFSVTNILIYWKKLKFLRCLTQFHTYISLQILDAFLSKKWATLVSSALHLHCPPPSPSIGAMCLKHPRNSSRKAGPQTGAQTKSAHSPRPSASSRRCLTNPNSSATWTQSAARSSSTSASLGSPHPTPFESPAQGFR